MARHRHVTCVRSDGLSAVLRPLLADRRIVAATLVDVGSGLTLDGYADEPDLTDLELVGAGHADLVRAASAASGAGGPGSGGPGSGPAELTVDTGDGRRHLLHAVPDPHGDRLVVAVVVRGGRWRVARARRRLRRVSVDALTAGPTLHRRPVDGTWFAEPTPTPSSSPAVAVDDDVSPAAPLLSAMSPLPAAETPPGPPPAPPTVSSVATPGTPAA